MTVTSAMLETYPKDLGGIDKDMLAGCIQACIECAQACTACADACLSEDMVAGLTTCIRTDLDCADVCEATGRCCLGTPARTPTSPVGSRGLRRRLQGVRRGVRLPRLHARALPGVRAVLPAL